MKYSATHFHLKHVREEEERKEAKRNTEKMIQQQLSFESNTCKHVNTDIVPLLDFKSDSISYEEMCLDCESIVYEEPEYASLFDTYAEQAL